MGSKKVDLTGMRFSRLVVLQESTIVKYKTGSKRTWKCLCDCGNIIIVNTGALTSKNTKSCGCLHDEISSENGKKSRWKVAKKDAGYFSIFNTYIHSAKLRGHEFTLTFDEFKNTITSNCYYCGIEPSNVYFKNYYNVKYNGIDRINNSIGYVKENIVPCCKMCNIAKNNNTYEEFMKWMVRIFKNTSTKILKMNSELIELVKMYPNDADLGEAVRNMIR